MVVHNIFRRLTLTSISSSTIEKEESLKLEKRQIFYIGDTRRVLTKKVPEQWYRRYCYVLPEDEKLAVQPYIELLSDAKVLREDVKVEEMVGQSEVKRACLLENSKKIKLKAAKDVSEGNVKRALTKLNEIGRMDLTRTGTEPKEEDSVKMPVYTLQYRKQAVLKKNSKWKMLKENTIIKTKLKNMAREMNSTKYRTRFKKAIRLVKSVLRFRRIMAEISRAAGEIFKGFSELLATESYRSRTGLQFDRTVYESSYREKQRLDTESMHTLRNLESLRTEAAITALESALSHRSDAFRSFPTTVRHAMCRVAWCLELPRDAVVIRQGQAPSSFYFLLSGRAAATHLSGSPVQGQDAGFQLLHDYRPHHVFGTQGLFDLQHREYSVVCTEPCVMVSISFVDYLRVTATPPPGHHNPEHLKFLHSMEFMRHFPVLKLVRECDQGNVFCFFFDKGAIISKHIRTSEYIFCIKSGKCRVMADVCYLNSNNRDCQKEKALTKNAQKLMKRNSLAATSEQRRQVNTLPKLPGIRPSKTITLATRSSTTSRVSQPVLPGTLTSKTALPGIRSTQTVLPGIIPSKVAMSSVRSSKKPDRSGASFTGESDSTEHSGGQGRAEMESSKTLQRHLRTSHSLPQSAHFLLKELNPGDVIGLEHLPFGDEVVEQCDVEVLSDGCEVVLVRKDFFMSGASPQMHAHLRRMAYVFPTIQAIKDTLRNQRYWQSWKEKNGYQRTTDRVNIL